MKISQADYRVASGRQGLSVALRNKRIAAGGQPILFIHGATYPSSVMFDYAIDGQSWMDICARAGFDAWCVDLLGYGLADRPAEMFTLAAANGPIVDTAEAVADVKRAIEFILAQTGAAQLDVVGYSWGSAIAGQIAGEIPDKIRRVVLGGALWLLQGLTDISTDDAALGAYRLVTADSIRQRWTRGLAAAEVAAIAPEGHISAWALAAIASDPDSRQHTPPQLRAPTGVVKDVQAYWMREQPTYDPARIIAPTMIVVGEWDRETTPAQGRALFSLLKHAATRRYTLIGRATHSMLLENQRHQLHAVVAGFLSENFDS